MTERVERVSEGRREELRTRVALVPRSYGDFGTPLAVAECADVLDDLADARADLATLRAREERYAELSESERGEGEEPFAVFEHWRDERDVARDLVQRWRAWAASHFGFMHDDASMRAKIDGDRAREERMRAVVEAARVVRESGESAVYDGARAIDRLARTLDALDREDPSAPLTVLAWVGSICGVPSPCANDDGAWNGQAIGDEEPCVLCADERCVARVIDWQGEGDAIVARLIDRMGREDPSARPERCPRCDSPAPHLHPAMQCEGEVEVCRDAWHGAERREDPPASTDPDPREMRALWDAVAVLGAARGVCVETTWPKRWRGWAGSSSWARTGHLRDVLIALAADVGREEGR